MLKKDITYTNPFTEKEVTETHFFHISKADLVEMELEENNTTYEKDGEEFTGMRAKLQRIVDSEDGKAILAEMKDMIRRSYGVKNGERFVKNEEVWKDFSSSEAFSQLLFDLCTDPAAAAEFMNGVLPGNLEQVAEEVRQQAERVAKGREAQETAKAAGAPPEGSTPEAALADAAERARAAGVDTSEVDDIVDPRRAEIANATSENPVTLTQAELVALDAEVVRAGLADGRYKLA